MSYEDYDGVVYDLDCTLVRLTVDWDRAAADVAAVYREAGYDADGRDLWRLFGEAASYGLAGPVAETLNEHEREGARNAERLPRADELVGLGRPAGVCSLNCEDACRIALEKFDLLTHVRAVVGRDTVANYKPHPEPLLATIERIGCSRERAVFVGDSERDEETARRAGVDFQYVDDEPSGV